MHYLSSHLTYKILADYVQQFSGNIKEVTNICVVAFFYTSVVFLVVLNSDSHILESHKTFYFMWNEMI